MFISPIKPANYRNYKYLKHLRELIPDKYWTSDQEASPPSCAGHEVTQEEHEADFSEKVYMNNPLTPFEPSVCFTYTQTSSDGTLH